MEQNEQNQSVPNTPVQPVIESGAPMDSSVKKPSRAALWFLGAVVVVVALLLWTSKMSKTDTAYTLPEGEKETLCYYSSTSSQSGINSIYSLKLDLNGVNARGELSVAPAEKDKMVGALSGVVIDSGAERVFNGTYVNSAEGMENTDQRIIKLSDAEAAVGYGDVTQNADGSYAYTDPNNLNFSLKIPRVNCGTFDELTG